MAHISFFIPAYHRIITFEYHSIITDPNLDIIIRYCEIKNQGQFYVISIL